MSAQRPGNDDPHIVSLVLQSKKALQHGKQLCLRASHLSSSSARNVVDVLTLDARVKWLSNAVLEQLKVRHPRCVFRSPLLIQRPGSTSLQPSLQRALNRNVHSCMSKPRLAPFPVLPYVYPYLTYDSNGILSGLNAQMPSKQRLNPWVLNSSPATSTLPPTILPFLAALNLIRRIQLSLHRIVVQPQP